jgi:integrase
LTVRRSKTDQDRAGQTVGVAHGHHALTDPVAALASWGRARGTAPGPLFTSMRNRRVTLEPVSGDAIARVLRTRARAAGLAAERITGHSLRAGHATEAAQTRHRRLSTLLERYIRPRRQCS